MVEPSQTLSRSVTETLELARRLAKEVRSGDILALRGELGSGKTTFAKGMISALTGIPEDEITSPSFTLVEEYPGEIYHVDLYRLENPKEAEALPWDQLMGPTAITLVEWPENRPPLISHCQWVLRFSKKDEKVRMIEITRQDLR